jgi:hypothetical protein
MRSLSVSVPLGTPSGFALAFLRTFFDGHKNGPAQPQFGLRVPLGTVASGLTIDKPVTFQLAYVKNPSGEHALEISWRTPESKAFPHFSGCFAATPEGENTCRLSLTGSYSAPGGVAGSIFDAAVGKRIARSTIEGLLQRLAAAAEADYQTRLAM